MVSSISDPNDNITTENRIATRVIFATDPDLLTSICSNFQEYDHSQTLLYIIFS